MHGMVSGAHEFTFIEKQYGEFLFIDRLRQIASEILSVVDRDPRPRYDGAGDPDFIPGRGHILTPRIIAAACA